MRQIAVKAGCSIATVSMALRKNPRISNSTRDRIARIAEDAGYTVDPVVSTLMNQFRAGRKNRTVEKIAYLTFWRTSDLWRYNVNENQYFIGACERASHLGYEVEHFWAKQPGLTTARLNKILYTRGIKGVVIGPLPNHLGHIRMDWEHFSCAALSLTLLRPDLHRASHNYHEGMMLALRNLKRLGYRRFGFANSLLFDQRVRHGWLSGYLTHQFQLPPRQHIPPLLMEDWRSTDAWKTADKANLDRFSKWVDRYKPDVVLSNTTHPLAYFRKLGLRVPEDIGYVSLHKLHDTDKWAGINRLPDRIGAAAVDLVVSQLQNNEFGLPACPKNVVLSGVWSDGPSVMRRARASEGLSVSSGGKARRRPKRASV